MSRRRVAATVAALALVTVTALATLATPRPAGAQDGPEPQNVPLAFESQVDDVSTDELTVFSLATLGDPRGWGRAGFTFTADENSEYRVILAEPDVVDLLCAPIQTDGSLSCQNGPVVALNATRWREAVDGWTDLNGFRQYLVNHEIGHLIGQFHPENRCPVAGEAESLMAPQSLGLEGCQPNAWPLDFEVLAASVRPVALAPDPTVEPDARSVNPGGQVPPTTVAGGTPTTDAATAATTTAVAAADVPATQPEDLPAATNDEGETVATLGDTPLSTPGGADTLDDAGLSSVGDRTSVDSNTSLPLIVLAVAAGLALIIGLVALIRTRRRRRPVVIPDDDDVDSGDDAVVDQGPVGDGDAPPTEIDLEAGPLPPVGASTHDGATADIGASEDDGAGPGGAATGEIPVAGSLAAAAAASPFPDEDTAAAPAVSEPDWTIRLAGGARREGAVAWLVPRRWSSEEADGFQNAVLGLAVEDADEPPDPATVGQTLGEFLRAHPHLAPDDHEAIGVTLTGTHEVVAAALGAAEVVELRSGLAKPARRQGVLRLRHHESSPLEVEVSSAASAPQRGRITVERNQPRPT
ncbi:MAG: DUF3152 domain-containing protein [Microthrixaceae bacterium]